MTRRGLRQFEVVTPDSPRAVLIAPQHSQHWRVAGAGSESNGQAERLSVLERQGIRGDGAAGAAAAKPASAFTRVTLMSSATTGTRASSTPVAHDTIFQ